MSEPTPPKRRLHLTLDLGADDLREAASTLWNIAEEMERDGREERRVTSGGWGSGYSLTMRVTDPEMDGDRFRDELKEWAAERRRQRDAEASP